MTLIDFLTARLDEDWEAFLDCGADTPWHISDPSRMLREVTAKRAVVRHARQVEHNLGVEMHQTQMWGVLIPLASVYYDHPDYDERWMA